MPRALTRPARRLWLLALCLYGTGVASDLTIHLRGPWQHGALEFRDVAVGVAASLFWPADLVAWELLGPPR
ncbi:MAG: hypothetical protein JO267_13830 [Alphaproteobacteria bacterium]|nr:hypothetical protein [Alphaproteobacteria bacterium]